VLKHQKNVFLRQVLFQIGNHLKWKLVYRLFKIQYIDPFLDNASFENEVILFIHGLVQNSRYVY
jgi:hypothetical protein